MKILVMVDMEGISGVVKEAQCWITGPQFDRAAKRMMADINACVEGCFTGGAGSVLVRLQHGIGKPLIRRLLDCRARVVAGTERMPMIDTCAGVILLGYHAMSGTGGAILAHTMSPRGWQNFWINGKLAGEIAIDAAIAGDHGVPVIMVSGDDKTCIEARALLPHAIAVQVKKGLGQEKGILLSQTHACRLLMLGAQKSVRSCATMRALRIRKPVRLRLELAGVARAPTGRNTIRLIDARTYEVTGRTVEEALNRL